MYFFFFFFVIFKSLKGHCYSSGSMETALFFSHVYNMKQMVKVTHLASGITLWSYRQINIWVFAWLLFQTIWIHSHSGFGANSEDGARGANCTALRRRHAKEFQSSVSVFWLLLQVPLSLEEYLRWLSSSQTSRSKAKGSLEHKFGIELVWSSSS